ncbi:DUF222 domain-containing protein [Smaragdicoccus niigatensis]
MYVRVVSSLTLLIRPDVDVSSMSKGELVDLITAHETAKSAAAAVQARAAVELLRLETAEYPGRASALVQRSVGTQIALARKDSPLRGRRHLSLAKALCTDLPHTMGALERGELSEFRAHLIARETNHLTSDDRRTVDHELAGGLMGAGDSKVADLARAAAQRADSAAAERRAQKARNNRWVGAWAKPDAMMMVKALLPFEHGLAVHRALRAHAEQARRDGDKRPIGQVMADEFVQRLLGKSVDHLINIEIGLVMNERTLLRNDNEAAYVPGFGHIPAGIARKLLADADKAWIRRLFVEPTSGELVNIESKRRLFSGKLRQLVLTRDRTCRTPYCNNQIRHIDHTTSWSKHRETQASGGQGLCEYGNYVKENPGWSCDVIHIGVARRTRFTTPTGHHYDSPPPAQPGSGRATIEIELKRGLRDRRA